jgi:response regulator RpfG family c-di-GMP phosphodiesterase/Flp pilus assembly protein TadD
VLNINKFRQRDRRSPKVVLSERLSSLQNQLTTHPTESLPLAKAILEDAKGEDDPQLLGRAHLLFGRAALQLRQAKEAIVSLEQASLLCGGTRQGLEALLFFGRALRDVGQSEKAVQTLQQLVQEGQAWGHLDLVADAMNTLSNLQFAQGAYGAALTTLNDAANIARRLGKPLQEAKFLNNTAQILTQLGDHQGALNHLLEAQSQLRGAQDDKPSEVSYLLNIGVLYLQMQDLEKAENCFDEALHIADVLGDHKIKMAVQNNLANVHLKQNHFSIAQNLFEAALKQAQKLGDVAFQIDNLDGLGELYFAQSQYKKALEMHQQALVLSQNARDIAGTTDALLHLGKDQIALGFNNQALESLYKTLALAQDANRVQTMFEAHELLSKAHKANNDFPQALYHFERFFEIRKEIVHDENERQRTMLKAQFALEQSRLERRLTQQAWHDLQLQLSSRTAELELTNKELVTTLATSVEYLEESEGEHAFRVGEYAARIAIALGWNERDAEQLRMAAHLHDLGKVGIPTEIRINPGKLTPEDYNAVRRHPEIADDLLEGVRSPLMQLVREIAYGHHERWDGSGYPQQLHGQDIPMSARIVAVADVYDIISRGRPYQAASSFQGALQELEKNSGTHFDPTVVKAALEVLR